MSTPAPLVLAGADRVGRVAAELVRNRLLARPRARLLLPAEAPEFYSALHDLPAGQATVLQTDELIGGGPSRAAALRSSRDGVGFGAVLTLDGSAEPAAEAARYAAVLEAAPIDAAVLVLGSDGRVALDEPPARRASGVRVVADGLTVGLGSLYLARELIVLATRAD